VRQVSLADFQRDATEMMHTHVARVDRLETGDVNVAAWVEVHPRVHIHLQPATLAQRQATDSEYTNPISHIAYCENDAGIEPGSSLVPVQEISYHQAGRFIPVGEQARYLILGKQMLASGSSPVGDGAREQVQVNLFRITAEA